jgi:hypothetical protein
VYSVVVVEMGVEAVEVKEVVVMNAAVLVVVEVHKAVVVAMTNRKQNFLYNRKTCIL